MSQGRTIAAKRMGNAMPFGVAGVCMCPYSIHYDCVAAAGNDGTDTKIYLASYSPAVIAVSAVKETGNIRWVNISRIAWSGR
jgi:hypothetical protein